jgi:Flp pilus assembly protein TadG
MAMKLLLLHRFRRAQDGTALVEFAISLPLILIVSFGTIDSMRLFWTYQAAVAGVRDAARYVARVAPDDICTTPVSLATHLAGLMDPVDVTAIIDSARIFDPTDPTDDGALYTPGVTFANVSATITCVITPGLRQEETPVVRVTADMSIPMPFTEVLTLVGGAGFGTLTTTIVEDARVFGL